MTSPSSPHLAVTLLLVGFIAACGHGLSQAPQTAPPALATITADDIERSPGVSLEELLVARIPGLSLGRGADGQVVIHIRGTTTIQGHKEPLVVLDGIPLEPTSNGTLGAINLYDIASVEVLKDAVSTAMYGVRGANGVILVKTRRPE
jgi:TonB-dependent starch-binding outer membrane protein SusC